MSLSLIDEIFKYINGSGNNDLERTIKIMVLEDERCINMVNKLGVSALAIATYFSGKRLTENIVKILLIYGADINNIDILGSTALMTSACCSGTYCTENTIKLLLEADAEINIRNRTGQTALTCAVDRAERFGTTCTITILIESIY